VESAASARVLLRPYKKTRRCDCLDEDPTTKSSEIELLWRLLLRLRKLRSDVDFLSEIVHLLIDLADLRRAIRSSVRLCGLGTKGATRQRSSFSAILTLHRAKVEIHFSRISVDAARPARLSIART